MLFVGVRGGLSAPYPYIQGGIMRRFSVNKSRSSRKFRKQVGRTKAANMRGPMRGGFRF